MIGIDSLILSILFTLLAILFLTGSALALFMRINGIKLPPRQKNGPLSTNSIDFSIPDKKVAQSPKTFVPSKHPVPVSTAIREEAQPRPTRQTGTLYTGGSHSYPLDLPENRESPKPESPSVDYEETARPQTLTEPANKIQWVTLGTSRFLKKRAGHAQTSILQAQDGEGTADALPPSNDPVRTCRPLKPFKHASVTLMNNPLELKTAHWYSPSQNAPEP